jgi:transmembrane sensor
MTNPASSSNDNVTDEAAYWCMRLNAEDCTPEERAAFAQWVAMSPANSEEFEAIREIWDVSDLLPRQTLPQSTQWVQPKRRRRLATTAAILLALLLTGLLGWQQGWLPDSYHRYQAESSTNTVHLPDGSEVQLNLNSAITFGNYRDRRLVELREGEAFFKVQHDAEHPFVVRVGKGSVTVTGTQFNIWKYQSQVIITLTEGSVKVLSDAAQSDQVAYLTPGLQARYDQRASLPEISSADTEKALAWRDGKLILDDLPLAEALPQINRYLDKPVLLANQATANIRIGGIYNTSNTAELVRMLPKVLPVYLSKNADGSTVIHGKHIYR